MAKKKPEPKSLCDIQCKGEPCQNVAVKMFKEVYRVCEDCHRKLTMKAELYQNQVEHIFNNGTEASRN